MRWRITLLAVLVLGVGFSARSPIERSELGDAAVSTPAGQPGACPVSRPTTRPGDEQPVPMWYTGPDEQIWVMIPPGRIAGGPVKTPWYKPAGTTLEVTGRRLDGDAPPLVFTDPPPSPTYEEGSFTPSGLGFPVAGCWEIEARAGDASLRVVVEILPRFYRPPIADCQDLYGVVSTSDALVLGIVEGTTPDRPGWAWQTIRPERIWKGDVPLGGLGGGSIEILQETRVEPVLRPEGRYVLFLQSRSGQPWRIVCNQLTVAEVDGDGALRRQGALRSESLWIAATLPNLERELLPLVGTGWAPVPAATPGA